ncbi:DUF4145 domain-containing protein [Sphingorhabdus sp.]|jgi:hypothetical protein|uniref:DUF4145 domain-containing protein n=1 Tax=Sphingorhabdus sp. TaxID=1902408 RepID=UPI002D1FA752|nr:DUF4145 domain-containing protein [Sphingorhabdus sp.]
MCGVLATQFWNELYKKDYSGNYSATKATVSRCLNCTQSMLWWEERLASPSVSTVAIGHSDLPENIRLVYDEARDVFSVSPRAAAALLRLTIQLLCEHLGQDSSNLNTAIGNLVKEGLPIRVQKALDTVRVIGNHAVHPGQIEINDDADSATALFALINYVVERLISEPAKIDELFENLPDSAKKAIERRDA